jgi:hypothetical protein
LLISKTLCAEVERQVAIPDIDGRFVELATLAIGTVEFGAIEK